MTKTRNCVIHPLREAAAAKNGIKPPLAPHTARCRRSSTCSQASHGPRPRRPPPRSPATRPPSAPASPPQEKLPSSSRPKRASLRRLEALVCRRCVAAFPAGRAAYVLRAEYSLTQARPFRRRSSQGHLRFGSQLATRAVEGCPQQMKQPCARIISWGESVEFSRSSSFPRRGKPVLHRFAKIKLCSCLIRIAPC